MAETEGWIKFTFVCVGVEVRGPGTIQAQRTDLLSCSDTFLLLLKVKDV